MNFGEFWAWGKNKRPKPKRLGAHITYILCLAGLAWLDGLVKAYQPKAKSLSCQSLWQKFVQICTSSYKKVRNDGSDRHQGGNDKACESAFLLGFGFGKLSI